MNNFIIIVGDKAIRITKGKDCFHGYGGTERNATWFPTRQAAAKAAEESLGLKPGEYEIETFDGQEAIIE